MILLGEEKDIIAKQCAIEDKLGETSVQVALLSFRIRFLTLHLKINKKDNHSRYGLFQMINKRKKLLKYLKKKNRNYYFFSIKALFIRN